MRLLTHKTETTINKELKLITMVLCIDIKMKIE